MTLQEYKQITMFNNYFKRPYNLGIKDRYTVEVFPQDDNFVVARSAHDDDDVDFFYIDAVDLKGWLDANHLYDDGLYDDVCLYLDALQWAEVEYNKHENINERI